jgi:hypothetical protein
MNRSIWTWIIPFIVLLVLIGFLPYLITTRYWFGIDFASTGQIGDTIGGIMAPFIAIIASLLTFGAFWVQFQANLQQRDQFQQQMKAQKDQFDQQLKQQKELFDLETGQQKSDSLAQIEMARVERFETRFFELIKLHKENVNEISINRGLIEGRKAFVYLFEEFRFSYWLLKKIVLKERSNNWVASHTGFMHDDENKITSLAFLIFFIGVGGNSDLLLRNYAKGICKSSFLDLVIAVFKEKQSEYLKARHSILKQSRSENPQTIVGNIRVYPKLSVLVPGDSNLDYTARYKPFSGHISNLGHYYRHLFQTVNFVDQFDGPLDENDRRKYVNSLRAQLSNHEQLLLYYNSLSKFGQPWNDISSNLIVKYKIIKNLPLPLANFGITPLQKYAMEIADLRTRGEDLFEWLETSNSDN